MKSNLIFRIRNRSIRYLLNLSGFFRIQGHWIYTKGVNENSIVIDLGANKGAFSSEMYKRFKTQCYAVEPDKNMFDEIEDLNIQKVNYAITYENGPVNFYKSYNAEASSIIKNFENRWGNKGVEVVEGITWDSFIDLLKFRDKRIKILKIDIEGSELDLIKSFTTDNIINIEQITVEFHDWLNIGLHEKTVEAIKKLVSLGFMAITPTPNHLWPVEMLFLNKRLTQLKFPQKLGMYLYKKVTFLKY